MKMANVRYSLTIVTLLASGGALAGLASYTFFGAEPAFAASPQEKAQARNDLNVVTASLRSVDTAYASGQRR